LTKRLITNDVAFGAGGVQQRDVPLVQEAHRRHQADAQALAARGAQRGAQIAYPAHDAGRRCCW